MRKKKKEKLCRQSIRIFGMVVLLGVLTFQIIGCAKSEYTIHETDEIEEVEGTKEKETIQLTEAIEKETVLNSLEETGMSEPLQLLDEPVIAEMDWSEYFGTCNGTAVFYNPDEKEYKIYNLELAEVRNSPCSTFKIVSSLIGLETGVISEETSQRTWSEEIFWNEDWNKDIDFLEAFRTSCVWYFKEVIEEIGPEMVQKYLDELQYGNCDISDWEGITNAPSNKSPALTGFWIEASLKLSAIEQIHVLEQIFYHENTYSLETMKKLEQAMKIDKTVGDGSPVYGKTGMGKQNGITMDCWFTGFSDLPQGKILFCVYLGETRDESITSQMAKQIALEILEDEYAQ